MTEQEVLRSRFENKYMPIPFSGCWLWMGATQNGYGKLIVKPIGRKKNYLYAHRLSYQFYRGEIPSGMYVCHHCDVPCCVNPWHLFLGTQKANMRDAAAKGRMRKPKMAIWSCGHAPITLPSGQRKCRECMRVYKREYERKRRRSLGIVPRNFIAGVR